MRSTLAPASPKKPCPSPRGLPANAARRLLGRQGAWLQAFLLLSLSATAADPQPPPPSPPASPPHSFRPEPGRFPPLEQARAYRGELVFVDHANRRGSLRIPSTAAFRFNKPHPFALLPYCIVRYHGAPADLRDIPLGTILHVRAFLPPDPATSVVPVLPTDGTSRKGSAPAENHVLLLEDEPSHCLKTGEVWRLNELELQNHEGSLLATRGSQSAADAQAPAELMTFDAATRIWRGSECLATADLVAEGSWPSTGKKDLAGQPVLLGLAWKPTPGGVFNRFHISDIWLDESAIQRAARSQTATHTRFIRSRWMPAWVDSVDYGTFGRAIVTATLFGGMDPSLYADFTAGSGALMNGVENHLKHTEGGTAGPSQMAARGTILEVKKIPAQPPAGSSGIQIRFETDLITEGIRPTRILRIRPVAWPDVHMPREEYVEDGPNSHEQRFPTPAIFPRY